MTTKDIRTAHVQVTCDVCGRTLLRGEHAETYLAGGSRRQVCELCTARAVHEGWVREGAALERGTRSLGGERRRSLLERLRRGGGSRHRGTESAPAAGPATNGAGAGGHHPTGAHDALPLADAAPRQVHAVPTSVEQRTLSAIERFNRSEHPRTVAGVARSLGAPVVVVRPSEEQGALMTVVASWELCWYRYEVDLSDAGAAVRLVAQGYELSEIPVEDRVEANAAADEYGTLAPA
ncbi:MAG: hypothetical protein JSS99_12765 [Actinobacteria bacterium]|nr:hypothetical protein [Actinomycetota bacterium]